VADLIGEPIEQLRIQMREANKRDHRNAYRDVWIKFLAGCDGHRIGYVVD
jgi:hypothetical protein